MLSTLVLTAVCAALLADAASFTGVLTDNDGYAVNAALSVDIASNGSASEWKWAWDHDSNGKTNVPNDNHCTWTETTTNGVTTITACKGQYYWFQSQNVHRDAANNVIGIKGNMYNTHGEECGWFGLGQYAPSASFPVQIHIGLGFVVSTMTVAWSTYENTTVVPGAGSVEWSLSPTLADGKTTKSDGDIRPFTVDRGRIWYTHMANMTGLEPSTRYYYKVWDATANESSAIFSFKTQPTAATLDSNLPELHLIYGDMGSRDAFTLCSTCTGKSLVCDKETCASANQTAGLIAEIRNSNHIVHTGDFAYNLQDGGGTVGDQFMVNIEQVAANVPYMVSIGNHENSAGNLAHFTERFRNMPSNSGTVESANTPSLAPNNWYFSWDAGLVHYISMSTEVYFGVSGGPDGTLEKQFEWIIADLEKAQANRANVPWIIVQGHRSIYCSCDGDCDGSASTVKVGVKQTDGSLKYGMEEVLFKYGVDLFINGHEHDYERSWPVYNDTSDQSNVNPKGTIYVVTGAAGSSELHEPFTREQPEWSAYRSNTFGYSRMYIHNTTHLHWQQVQTDPTLFGPDLYGRVIDDAWIVQNKHGPFNALDAPSGKCPDTGCTSGISYDHWLPMLLKLDPELSDKLHNVHSGGHYHTLAGVQNTNHSHIRNTFTGKEYELIARFRAHNHGKGQWKREELNLLANAAAELGGGVVWEDIHEDGNSDGKWENVTWKNDFS